MPTHHLPPTRLVLSFLYLLTAFSVRAQKTPPLQDSIQKTLDSTVAHVYDNLDKSISVAESMLEQSLANGFKKQERRSYYCLGLSYYHKGFFLVSNDYYARIAHDPESEPKERSAAWNNMGVNYEMLRQFDSSLYAYQESMKIDQRLGDHTSEHMVLINMGLLNYHVHRPKLAFMQTRKALEFFQKKGDWGNAALCYMNFGIYYEEAGNLDSAIANSRRAEEIYRREKDYPNLVLCYNNQVNMWLVGKRPDKAREAYRKVQEILPYVDSPYHAAALHAMASNLFWQTQQFDSAIVHSREAIRLYEELSVAEYVVRENFFLARIYAEAGRVPEFRETIRRYDSLNIELNVKELSNRLAEMEVKYKLEAKNKEIVTSRMLLLEQRKFIIVISAFALCLLVALIITYSLYARVKSANRSLYRKNIELMEQPVPVAESPSETADAPVREESALLVKFRKLLEEKELYKNPELSLRSAAQELGTNEKYLSQAINAGGGENFNSFVNRFRVNEARRIILEGGNDELGMEELGLMVGFSNRHTFSRAFTQVTGISPSVFRKIHLSDTAV